METRWRDELEKLEIIYDGSTKRRYKTDNADVEIIEYKDILPGKEPTNIYNKGSITNRMTNLILELLEENNIPTHFIEAISQTEVAVKKSNPFPFFVKIRNYASGMFVTRTGVNEGVKLKTPVLEFVQKNKDLKENLINGYYVLALDYATQAEMDKMVSFAFRINEILIDFFGMKGMELVDVKLEFGRNKGDLILIDEISPETCRLWDKNNHERLDADRFRLGLGNVEEAYLEIAHRLQIDVRS